MYGVSSITAWLTQASDRAKSGRDKTVSVTTRMILSFALPDGVIGNTWPFGGHIPGSSPGRVAFAIYYLLFIIDYLEKSLLRL